VIGTTVVGGGEPMRIRRLVLIGALIAPASALGQSANDSLAITRGTANAVASKPGGPLLVSGDGTMAEMLATSLNTRRARTGELPNCGGLVGRMGVGPISQAGGYVVVIKAPEFSGDRAVVNLELHCMNTMGGRRGNVAKNEVLVFRRDANDWVLATRSRN
jgi:hypothetical protein